MKGKKARAKAAKKRARIYSQLNKDMLDVFDLIHIGAALIKARDAAFDEADKARKNNNVARASTFEHHGFQYNKVLIHLNHPAAII